MTPRERAAFRRWCNDHEGAVVGYGLGVVMALFFGGMIGDVLNSWLFFGIIVGLSVAWPPVLLVLNGTVLFVRYRIDRNLTFERKAADLAARERRIAALEGDTGV